MISTSNSSTDELASSSFSSLLLLLLGAVFSCCPDFSKIPFGFIYFSTLLLSVIPRNVLGLMFLSRIDRIMTSFMATEFARLFLGMFGLLTGLAFPLNLSLLSPISDCLSFKGIL